MDRLLDATARAEREHFWFKGFRKFITPLVRQAAADLGPCTFLDCGCGTGNNLQLLRQYGRAFGIDLSATGLSYAKRRGERAVVQASAVQLPFADATFDVVTSFDVIITLQDADEAAALREMHRVLKSGGHLVLNVAAMEMLRGNHSILAREVRRYSRSGLRGRLAKAGFSMRRLSYTNAVTTPLLAVVRLSQRMRGHRETEQEIAIPARPVNTLLTAALSLEAAALRFMNMPFGSSLIVLARKD